MITESLSFPAMNTYFEMFLWHHQTYAFLHEVCGEAQRQVLKLEQILSRYNVDAEVYQLNRTATEQPQRVSPVLFQYLEQSLRLCQQTQGLFNIGYCADTALTDCLHLDHSRSEAFFSDPSLQLDFGGIGKGIALKKIAEILDIYEIAHAFVSFGGSSILTKGRHPYADHWLFDLRNSEWDHPLPMTDSSLSISGYQGQNHHQQQHIINPEKKQKQHRHQLVVVQHHCPMEAEAISTALMVADQGQRQHILEAFEVEDLFLL
ncbi:FAD:protein FMN transferase [Persicobacter psychrovividus]|uniref:FAD:protein FMN transferase n=1 Tax=Persicobacter psychrovividus TaxID=387638 RepID=A0ABN6LFS4_9BACT|nr:hypothetical protein PEPS_43050 [Persicobacter psychrovividus]